MRKCFLLSAFLGCLTGVISAQAGGPSTLTIRDHVFTPARLEVPAHEKLKIIVKNEDATAEEFESHDLKREKIVPGNGQVVIAVGPLKPGVYKFFGEFHENTAQGEIVAK